MHFQPREIAEKRAFAIFCSTFHSDRKLRVGLALAAFTEMKKTVVNPSIAIDTDASAKTGQLRGIRNA